MPPPDGSNVDLSQVIWDAAPAQSSAVDLSQVQWDAPEEPWDKLNVFQQTGAQLQSGYEGAKQGYYAQGLQTNTRALEALDAADAPVQPPKPDIGMRNVGDADFTRMMSELSPAQRMNMRRQSEAGLGAGVGSIVESQAKQRAIPRNPRSDAMGEAVNAAEYGKAAGHLLSDPLGIPGQYLTESMPANVPVIASTVGAGLLGGPVAAMIAGAVSAAGADVGPRSLELIMGTLQSGGVDVTNPEAVRSAVQRQPWLVRRAFNDAGLGSVAIGAVQALTQGLTRPLSRALSPRQNIGRAGYNLGVHTVGEPAGEAGAQFATSGEITSPADVVAEALGALPMTVSDTISQTLADRHAGLFSRPGPTVEMTPGQSYPEPPAPGLGGPVPPAGPTPPPPSPAGVSPEGGPSGPVSPNIVPGSAGPMVQPVPAAPPPEPPNPLQGKKASLAEALADPRTNEQIAADAAAAQAQAIEQARAGLPPGFGIAQVGDEWVLTDPAGGIVESSLGTAPGAYMLAQWTAAAADLNQAVDFSPYTRVGTGTPRDPVVAQQPTDVAAAADLVAPPTPGQAQAGNYQMGHVKVGPLNISIETPLGAERSGTSDSGEIWSVQMPADYGYIKRSEGADGDHVDVYLGPQAHEAAQHQVFVVDQINPDTGEFDEHKAMIGFPSQATAQSVYGAGFSDGSGPNRIGAVTPMSFDQFVNWVRKGDTKKAIAYEPPPPPPLTVARQRALYDRPLTLIEFLAASGGIKDSGGELASMGLTDRFVPKIGRLVRQNGRPLDYARELAEQAGYLRAESANRPNQNSTADLLNLLAEEASGRPIYTPEVQAEMDAARQAEWEALVQGRYDEAAATLAQALDGSALVMSPEQMHRATVLMLEGYDTREAVTRALLEEHHSLDDEFSALADQEYIDAIAHGLDLNTELAAAGPVGTADHWDIPFTWEPENEDGTTIRPSGETGAEPSAPSVEATGSDTAAAPEGDGGSGPVGSGQGDQDTQGGPRDTPAGERPADQQPEPASAPEPEQPTGRDTDGGTESTPGPVQGTERPRDDGGEQTAEADTGPASVARAFADAFLAGRSFASIQQARAFAAEKTGTPIKPGTIEAKTADEAIELGVVLAARQIVADMRDDPAATFDRLLKLYGQQPNLNVRTAGSIERQAYSTPVPLAWVASQLAGITPSTVVYEPTAGNGALLIGAHASLVAANELDPDRVAALREQRFGRVTSDDATMKNVGRHFRAVIANPPFGAVRGDNGQTVRYDMSFVQNGYNTGEVDHAIALRALDAMRDDGRGVLILGGINKLVKTPKGRADAYNGKAKREFFKVLYDNYNVVDHFTVPGELYAKQGAAWPVDVIVIDGRGKSALPLPAVAAPRIVSTWDAIKEVMVNADAAPRTAARDKPVVAEGSAEAGVGEPGQYDSVGNPTEPRGNEGAADNVPVSDVAGSQGAVDDRAGGRPGRSDQPVGEQPRTGERVGRPEQLPEPERGSAGNVAGQPDVGASVPAVGGTAQEPVPSAPDAGSRAGDQRNVPGRVDEPRDTGPQRDQGLAPAAEADAPAAPRAGTGAEVTQKAQVAYEPGSKGGKPVGTLVPTNLSSATRGALDALAQRMANREGGANLDAFVADRLGYTQGELIKYFSAEQIDAIALGVEQIDKGQGFVIGDQTGVGKGRVVAAMIRYAERTGLVPIFVTEKPNLFADMARDLNDIGMPDMVAKILPTNGDLKLALTDDPKGPRLRTPETKKHDAELTQIAGQVRDTGRLPDAYRVVMTTYNQLQTVKGNRTARMNMVESLAPNAFLILDEAHNAGGSGGNVEETVTSKGKLVLPRSVFFRQLVAASRSTFYSSATWAKRPDVMDLYGLKTGMMAAVDNPSELADAIRFGGVPMQQIVTSQLAQMGQYIRRERSFDGVTYDMVPIPVDRKTYNEIAGILAAIFRISDEFVKPSIKEISKEIRASASAIAGDQSIGSAGASSTGFGAVMHNLINQMLLASKAQGTVDRALIKLKEDKKPVITVANTMGSFIEEFAADNEAKNGDLLDLTFNSLLTRYLERTLRFVEKKPFSAEKGEVKFLKVEDLGADGARLYRETQKRIASVDLSAFPVSPIDYIRAKLIAAGYSVGEITGRTEAADYRADGRVYYRVRPGKEMTTNGRQETIRAFNRGDLDVIILNQSGATGLSLHANSTFKDQRKRSMLLAQAEANIDTHMQMLGRVHRTGQVIAPEYEQLIADIPAEKRPAAVLANKMASLNASTTSSRKAVIGASNTPDFINKYGGAIIDRLLDEMEGLSNALGDPRGSEDADIELEALARKATGRIPLLPLDMQEEVYSLIEDRYRRLIEELDAAGENALEAKTLDLDARLLEQRTFVDAKPGADERNPFASSATMQLMDVKRQSRPPKPEMVVQDLARAVGAEGVSAENMQGRSPDDLAKTVDHIALWQGSPAIEELTGKAQAAVDREIGRDFKDPEAKTKHVEKVQAQHHRITSFLRATTPGTIVDVLSGADLMPTRGLVLNMALSGKSALAPSNYELTIMTEEGIRRRISGSSLYTNDTKPGSDMPEGARVLVPVDGQVSDFLGQLTEQAKNAREERWIITGNILAAYSKQGGQIVNFTDAQGEIRQGIMLAKDFDPDKALAKIAQRFTADSAERFLTAPGLDLPYVHSPDKAVRIAKDSRGAFVITTPAAKGSGGDFYLNKTLQSAIGLGSQFIKSGPNMRASVRQSDLRAVLDTVQTILSRDSRELISDHPEAKKWATGQATDAKPPSSNFLNRIDSAKFSQGEAPRGWGGLERDVDPLRPEVMQAAIDAVQKIVGPQGTIETTDAQMTSAPGLTAGSGVGGMAIGGLIRVATGGNGVRFTWNLHHEAVHVLRNLGLFTGGEWRTLEAAARRQGWIDRFDLRKRYPGLSEDKLIEEAIAEAFAAASTNPDAAPKGVLTRAWEKVKRFLAAFRNALAGRGFSTEEGVFERAQAGEIGGRDQQTGTRGPQSLDEARARADVIVERLTIPDENGNDVDLMLGMSPELERRIREAATRLRQENVGLVTRLWRGTPTPSGVQVIEPEQHRDINPLTRWVKTPEYVFRGTELAPVIQAGIRAEERQSIWIRRLTEQYDDVRKTLEKAGGDFDKVSEALWAGDADQVDIKDDTERADLFDAWALTDDERAAFMGVHRLLEAQARMVDNHRRAMMPQVRAQKQAAMDALERFMTTKGVSGSAARRLYRERAVLTKRISDGISPDVAADSKRVAEINAELRRARAADPANADTITELQETIDGLEARLNATAVRGRIKGYVPHKFYGSWRMWEVGEPDEEGGDPSLREITSDQGFYTTREQALAAARDYLQANPGANLRIAPKQINWPAGMEGTQVSDASYRRLASKLAESVGVEGPALHDMLQGVARRRNRRRVYTPGMFRSGAEGYSRSMDRIMRTHIGQTVRYVTMDKLKYQAITASEAAGLSPYRITTQERPELQRAFEAWFRDVNGSKQPFEAMIDRALTRFPVPVPVAAAAATGFALMGGAGAPVMASAMAGYLGYRMYRSLTNATEFPTRTFTNSLLSDMGHLKLGGFLNLKSALVNLTQITLNTYPVLGARWTAEGIRRGGQAVWDSIRGNETQDTKLLDRADIRSIYRMSEAGPVLAEHESRLAKMSMFWFQTAETMNRAVTFFGAYARAESEGKSPGDALNEAKLTMRRTQFHNGAANRPELLRQVWMRLPGQFKSFMANQIAFVFGLRGRQQIGRFLAMMFLLGGITATAGFQVLDKITDIVTGWSPQQAVEKAVLEAHAVGNMPGNAATALAHGLPAVFTDISQSVGMGAGFLPMKVGDLAGPWISTLMKEKEANEANAGIVDRLALASPSFNWLKALEAAANGRQITSAGFYDPSVWGDGQSAWTDWRKKNATLYSPSTGQLIGKALNFTPAGESLMRSMAWQQAQAHQEHAQKVKGYLGDIVQAHREGRTQDIAGIAMKARKEDVALTQKQITEAIKQANREAMERTIKNAPKADRPELYRQGQGVERQLGR